MEQELIKDETGRIGLWQLLRENGHPFRGVGLLRRAALRHNHRGLSSKPIGPYQDRDG